MFITFREYTTHSLLLTFVVWQQQKNGELKDILKANHCVISDVIELSQLSLSTCENPFNLRNLHFNREIRKIA